MERDYNASCFTVFRRKPPKIVGGGVKKPVKFFIVPLIAFLQFKSAYSVDITNFFGIPDITTLGSLSEDVAISTPSQDISKTASSSDANHSVVYSRILFMVTEYNNNGSGIKLCPVQVNSIGHGGTDNRKVSLTYNVPNGDNNSTCFWLCQSDDVSKTYYTGDNCNTKVACFGTDCTKASVDYSTKSNQVNGYDNLSKRKYTSLDSNIAVSNWGTTTVSFGNSTNGLAIHIIATSFIGENGALITPIELFAWREGWKFDVGDIMHSKPYIKLLNSSQKAFCSPGYWYKNGTCTEITFADPCKDSNYKAPETANGYEFTVGNGKYKYTGQLKCEYTTSSPTTDHSNWQWVPAGDGNKIECQPGYYGVPNIANVKYGVNGSSNWVASGCTPCTSPNSSHFGPRDAKWEYVSPESHDGTAATMCVIKQKPTNTENGGCSEGQVLFGTKCYVPFVDENGNSFIIPDTTTCELGWASN